jgi:deoxyribonuclease-4
MPFLGAHLSAAGGAWRAASAAAELGCTTLQIFLRPPGRWAAPALDEDAVARFLEESATAGLSGRCFAHAPYLLNLASADAALRRRSLEVLVDELQRAGRLGLAGVVLHPGSAGSGSRSDAEERCRDAVGEAVERAGDGAARLLLEGTAGGGGHLGRSPEELARLAPEASRGHRGRVGICLDTAHLWGVGFDLLGRGWEEVLEQVATHWGVAAPDLLHANDTPVALGSRRDRHAPPGEGALGKAFYRRLLVDARLAETPLILEIPPGAGNALVARALRRLARWARDASR